MTGKPYILVQKQSVTTSGSASSYNKLTLKYLVKHSWKTHLCRDEHVFVADVIPHAEAEPPAWGSGSGDTPATIVIGIGGGDTLDRPLQTAQHHVHEVALVCAPRAYLGHHDKCAVRWCAHTGVCHYNVRCGGVR